VTQSIDPRPFTQVAREGLPEFIKRRIQRKESYDLWGSREREWMHEEWKRWKYGLTVNGVWMPGKLYSYVNYGSIMKLTKEVRKTLTRPDLRDIDWWMAWCLEIARKEKKGLGLLTSRRAGKSYFMGSWNIAHEMIMYKNSSNCIGAVEAKYSNNTMTQLKEHLEGLKGTPFFSPFVRLDIKDLIKLGEEVKVDGDWLSRGLNSKCENVVFKDRPLAANGKSSSIFVFEEAGLFKNLIESYNNATACWSADHEWWGIPVVFGTGGDIRENCKDFQKMFYDPGNYNLLEFFCDKKQKKPSMMFIPAVYTGSKRDDNGFTIVPEAYSFLKHKREKLRENKDKTPYMTEIQDFPLTPHEAFMVSEVNRFPKDLLYNQLEKVLTLNEYRYKGQVGSLIQEGTEVRFKPKPDIAYLDPDDHSGDFVIIYEHPDQAEAYTNLYIACGDPYMHEEGGTSCASFFVYKRFADPFMSANMIVASYFGRTKKLDELYNTWLLLCKYYNAKLMFENNITGPKQYFESQNATSFLAAAPTIISALHSGSRVDRRFGVHMTSDIKEWGLNKIRDWLLTDNHQGGLNVDYIYDEGLLRELLSWEDQGNYDRVSALIVLMIYIEELYKNKPKDKLNRTPLFSSILNTYYQR
jgi:hypothetical protein